MGASISNSFDSERPPAARPAARAPRPKGYAVDRVAADPAIGDTDPETAYRDSVEHVRQSRLRLWQEQR